MRTTPLLCLALTALVAACAEKIEGPPVTLEPAVAPAVVCNASDVENRALETRVLVRPAAGSSFAPLPVDTLTPDASLAIPRVTLRDAMGRDVAVRQVEFVSPREMALWVTRTTRDGMPVEPGTYAVTVTNPDGQRGVTMTAALRVVPPPTVTGVTRLEPTVPAMGVEADEAQTVCNGFTTTLSVAGTNFRPMDPTPVVEVVTMAGAVVRRVADPDVRVVSATELRITLRAPADPASRLAPGRYGLRVTNPDGTPSTATAQGDGGVADGGDASATGPGTVYPQGCRATNPSLFEVVPPPEVRAIEPVSACSSREQRFVVRGAYFRRGLTVTVASSPAYVVPAAAVVPSSSTGNMRSFDTLTLTVPMGAVPPGGGYALAVRNADGCDVVFGPQCPAGTSPTGAPNECQGMVGTTSGTGPRSITFYPDPVVTGIMPTGLCTAALMPVTLTGMNFHSTWGVQPVVRVGGAELTNVRVTSPTTITAEVPMSLMAGAPLGTAYDVTVTVPEGCSGTRAALFTLFPPPTLTAVREASVCGALPSSTLTLTGTNFHTFEGRGPTVTLGTTPPTSLVNVRVMSPTTILADLPMNTPPGGPYDVTVTSPVACGATLPRAFTYHAVPTVTMAVAQASCTGGLPVLALTGTSFHTTNGMAPTVTLGATMLGGVRVLSPTTLTAEIPMSVPAGTYRPRVVMPEGCAADGPDVMFNPTTLVTPTLAGMFPSRGWSGIDMPVTVVGTGLATITGLALANASASGNLALTDLRVASADLLDATIPAGGRAGGPYDLVSTVAGCPLRLAGAYTITDTPAITITRVTPPFGWTGGTTPIVLEGTGFVSTPRLFIVVPSLTPRMRPLSRPVFVSATTVTAVVPAGLPPGTYDIAAINPDGGGGVIRNAFRVTRSAPPTITSVNPGSGTTQGPTNVTITGANFRMPEVTLRNAAGTTVATATVRNATATTLEVTFPTGSSTPVGAYVVRVNNPDEMTFADFGSFVVTNPAEKLSPFAAVTPLTTARRGHGVVASQLNAVTRFLYAIGGDGGASGPTHATVEFTTVDFFGNLGAWREQRYRLPSGLTSIAGSTVARNGHVWVVGGATSNGTPQAAVLHARVLDFSTSPVISDPEITRVRTGGLAPGAWIYRVAAVMGSSDADNPAGESLPSDQVTAFFASPPGATNFNSTVTLRWSAVPGAASYRVYRTPTVNGASGSERFLTSVMGTTFTDDGTVTPPPLDTTNPLNSQPLAAGSTGVWTVRQMLGAARAGAAAAIAPDPSGNLFLYALTGRGASGRLASWEVAPLTAGAATLGAFRVGATAFPTARDFASAAVASPETAPRVTAGSFVYVSGGFDAAGGARAIEYGRVGANGDLLAITSNNANARGATSTIIVNGDYYALGGSMRDLAGAGLATAGVSSVMTNGAPANFSNASVQMMSPRHNFGLGLASAHLFVVGGTRTGADALTAVEKTIY